MDTSLFEDEDEAARTDSRLQPQTAARPSTADSGKTTHVVDYEVETRLPPLNRFASRRMETHGELPPIKGSAFDGHGDAAPAWETVPNAAFDEVVARIIMDPLHELDLLDTVFIRREADGSTLLHVIAGWANCSELVKRLLLRGIPPDAADDSGWTPLLEAAQEGQIAICEVLLAHGATPTLAVGELTPLRAAAEVGNEEATQWLLEQPDTWSGEWDSAFFSYLLAKTPGAATSYLDRFATVLNHSKRGFIGVRYSQLRALYGEPHVAVEDTALALAVQSSYARDILSHRVMKYLLKAKWKSFARAKFRREFSAYALLLSSYFLPTIYADPDWTQLQSTFDYWVCLSRVVAWSCCVYLLITVELNEFLGDSVRNYFLSFWNVLNIVTYVATLVSIPVELQGSDLQDVRNSLLALIIVSLWVNLLQFLQVSTESGLLIAMMSHMVKDVYRFLMLYAVFICGYSGAFYLLLRGQNGYESFTNSFITVFLMLFGAIDYSVFTDKALQGGLWYMGNFLLLTHLVSVVIVLLNILIAMMATTYSDVWEAAEAEALQSHAQAILRMERSLRKSERLAKYEALLKPPAPPPLAVAAAATPPKSAKLAPSLDKIPSAASSVDVLSTRWTAKRHITRGVLSKLNALPVASDVKHVVDRALARSVHLLNPRSADHTKSNPSAIHPDASPPLDDDAAANAIKPKKKVSSFSGLVAGRPGTAGAATVGFIEQLIEVPNLNVLEQTLFLKSAFDRDDDGFNANGSMNNTLATLEDGIRYELPVKKAKEHEQLAAMHELRERVEQLTKAVIELQTDHTSSSASLRPRQLVRRPTLAAAGFQFTTSVYQKPKNSTAAAGDSPAVRTTVASIHP